MIVEVEIFEGEVVCERCGSAMTAQTGRPVAREAWDPYWLWWRCETGHISAALPVPSSWVGILGGVMPYGSSRLQPPELAGAPAP